MRRYLTPDEPEQSGSFYIVLRLPHSVQFRQMLKGALFDLTQPEQYEQFGSMNPEDAAEMWATILSEVTDMHLYAVGDFVHSMSADPPANYIPCYGGDLAMVDWPELMEVYPSILKNYPSTGRFVVPDARGRNFIGDGTDVNGYNWQFLTTGGARQHTLTENEMPSHAHSYVPPVFNVDLEAPGVPDILGAGLGVPTNTGNAGGGLPHNNMPPYAVTKVYMVGRVLP